MTRTEAKLLLTVLKRELARDPIPYSTPISTLIMFEAAGLIHQVKRSPRHSVYVVTDMGRLMLNEPLTVKVPS